MRLSVYVLIVVFLGLKTSANDGNAQSDERDSSNQTLIATVFGNPLYLEGVAPPKGDVDAKRRELAPLEFKEWFRAYRARRTYQNVWGVVQQEYIKRDELEVTDEEFAGIIKSVERHLEADLNSPPDTTFTPEQRKGITIAWQRASFQDWKVCKSLYEKYGGRVGVGSLGAWVAFDGQNAVLREHHQAGNIKFHDPDIGKGFWQHTKIKNFADAYPTGERLKRRLETPPYLRNQPPAHRTAENSETFGGKSLDQWIAQARQGRNLNDRNDAMQVLRTFGLRRDRTKTLRTFTELLSDNTPTVQSLAAVGLRQADGPTDPSAMDRLVEILSQDLSNVKILEGMGDVGGEFGRPMRAVSALGTLGETTHIPVLQRIVEEARIAPLLRQAAKHAF